MPSKHFTQTPSKHWLLTTKEKQIQIKVAFRNLPTPISNEKFHLDPIYRHQRYFALMYYSKCTNGYVLRLEAGEEVQESLRLFSQSMGLRGGFYQGIGTLTQVELAFFRINEQKYDHRFFDIDYEVISLMGNISLVNESPVVHSHVCLGDSSFNTISGHLVRGIVSLTVEILITPIDITLTRKEDPLLKFKGLISQNRLQLKM